MKKVCLYIIAVILVIIIALGLSGDFQFKSIFSYFDLVPTEEEAVKSVYEALRDGEEYVTIRYAGDKNDLETYAQNVVDQAFFIDDSSTSDDFDYMKNKYRGYTAGINGLGIYNIRYKFQYGETSEQTQWVNDEIKKILEEMQLDKKSEYEKIKKIHDYIIDTISYDITVQYNSAYEGLRSHATACQGYANLTYKMLTEAGLNCRVITGTADGEAHAWNIVQIGDVWYNLDCTWDDPLGGGVHNSKYDYFLKNNYQFSDHERDQEYNTEQFNEEYKMAKKSWVKK